jgi:hypothetical protein
MAPPCGRCYRYGCMRRALVACTIGLGCSRAASAPPAAHAPEPAPPPIEPPAAIACTLRASRWPTEEVEDSTKGRQFLRFGPGMAPFARLFHGTDARLHIPVEGANAGALVELDANGVLVRGRIDAKELPLYPASAFTVADVFVPNHERRMLFRSARPGFLTVALEPMPHIRGRHGDLTAERACTDLSLGAVLLEQAAIDTALRAPKSASRPATDWLRPGRVPLAPAPGAEAAVEIDVVEPPDDTLLVHPVRLLAVERDHARIAAQTFGGTLVGWVPRAQLRRVSRQYVDLSHDCFTSVINAPRTDGHFVTCPRSIPLFAEVGGERRMIGTIRSGVAVEPTLPRSPYTQVAFRDAGITEAEGASFLVHTADLTSCR